MPSVPSPARGSPASPRGRPEPRTSCISLGGVMCPSFRVTREERDVTRGRANTLRLALTGQLGADALTSDGMAETLALCVSCKACRRECPTGVDMARMKIEVLAARAEKYGLSVHDRLVGFLPRYAELAARLSWLFNLRDALPGAATVSEALRDFPLGDSSRAGARIISVMTRWQLRPGPVGKSYCLPTRSTVISSARTSMPRLPCSARPGIGLKLPSRRRTATPVHYAVAAPFLQSARSVRRGMRPSGPWTH